MQNIRILVDSNYFACSETELGLLTQLSTSHDFFSIGDSASLFSKLQICALGSLIEVSSEEVADINTCFTLASRFLSNIDTKICISTLSSLMGFGAEGETVIIAKKTGGILFVLSDRVERFTDFTMFKCQTVVQLAPSRIPTYEYIDEARHLLRGISSLKGGLWYQGTGFGSMFTPTVEEQVYLSNFTPRNIQKPHCKPVSSQLKTQEKTKEKRTILQIPGSNKRNYASRRSRRLKK
jgi:hypothetical protein